MLTAPLETSRPKPFGCSGKKLRRVSYTRTRQASSRPFRPLTLECTCRVCSSLYRKPLTALCAALKKIGRGPNFTRASTSSRAGPSGVCLEPTPHCWKADAWELFCTMSSATITSKRGAQFMEQKELCEQPDVPISCPACFPFRQPCNGSSGRSSPIPTWFQTITPIFSGTAAPTIAFTL